MELLQVFRLEVLAVIRVMRFKAEGALDTCVRLNVKRCLLSCSASALIKHLNLISSLFVFLATALYSD